VEDDRDFGDCLSQFLRVRGIQTIWFSSVEELLRNPDPYGFDFYILDLMLPGTDGLNLLQMLRRRSDVGILVVSGKLGSDVFEQVIGAGADMHLAKPATFEQILMAVSAVFRRSAPLASRQDVWRLDEAAGQLVAPDGALMDLSPTDLSVLQCLLSANGEAVSRAVLSEHIGLSADDDPNLLAATIYRLRRKIERTTTSLVPLQHKSRQGYAFRARLVSV
jgi:DNA-binding response OmpR family regulator